MLFIGKGRYDMGNKNEETKEMLPEDKMIQALTENSEANLTAANIPSEEPLPDDFAEAGEIPTGQKSKRKSKRKRRNCKMQSTKKNKSCKTSF